MRLEGQTVVIVGGSSGIGRGAATALLDRGASVVLVARSIDKLREASDALGGPPHVRIFSADARRETDVERLFREIGRFDHLVVTSGIVPPTAPIASFDLGVARELIETVLLVPITLAKHAHGVIRVGGSITFASGISKDRPVIPGGSVTAAVAGSLDYFVRALARELGPTRVNVVSPGWVKTPMWDTIAGEGKNALWDEMASRLPARRIATPADIALAYLYLIESELTTGTTLKVDGGHALI